LGRKLVEHKPLRVTGTLSSDKNRLQRAARASHPGTTGGEVRL
jgi:hypothetical protein